jgi:hypothetical protein
MLDSSAKLSDIIASLQESEGINQKAELKSNLTAQDVEVLDADDMATLVSKVKDIKHFKLGITEIVDSSHPTTDAPTDLPYIQLEFYSKIIVKDYSAIQVLENESTNIFDHVTTDKSVDVESLFIAPTRNLNGNTDYKVILPKGCIQDKFNNEFNVMEYDFHTTANTPVWLSYGNLNIARGSLGGCGTQSAGLSFGGTNNGVGLNITEKYNGTSWASSNDLNAPNYELAGCGYNNAGLAFGGHNGTGILSSTQKYNGTVWSGTGYLIQGRYQLAGCGNQSNALSFGGATSGSVATTEKFLEIGWCITINLNVANNTLAGCGNGYAGLAFGGYGSSNYSSMTEKLGGN